MTDGGAGMTDEGAGMTDGGAGMTGGGAEMTDGGETPIHLSLLWETKRGVGVARLRWRLSGWSGYDKRSLRARNLPPPT